jgi:hypothetical protein
VSPLPFADPLSIGEAPHHFESHPCYFNDQNTGWVVGGKLDPSCPTPPPGTPYNQYAKLKPVVLKTTDGGRTWVNKATGVQGFECGEWGWKIQWLDAMHGFVSLENFTAAAILTTVDGGETWVRRPVADATGKQINLDLEGVGFITPDSGWVGGWGDNFEGLKNSATTDGGRTWVAEDNTPSNPASDPRTRINRYRFLGSPPTLGYCSGHTVYKRGTKAQAVALASAPRRAHPAGLSLSHRSFATARSVEISYTLDTDADSVFVGIWNHFAFHVRDPCGGRGAIGGAPLRGLGRHRQEWQSAPWRHIHLPNFGERGCRRKPKHRSARLSCEIATVLGCQSILMAIGGVVDNSQPQPACGHTRTLICAAFRKVPLIVARAIS